MNVDFYTFAKRDNSTKQPTKEVANRQYCNAKDPMSIMNPIITLDRTSVYGVPNWNYAYIEDFNRYYFIEDWTYAPGIWIATLSIDVLATWRWAIENENLYCVRTSNEFNMDKKIIDSRCVTTTDKIVETSAVPTPFRVESMSNGTYVIGVSGKNGVSGGVTYYALDCFSMQTLCNLVFDETQYGWSVEELSFALTKSLVDPLQYVVSASWFPFTISEGSVVHSIDFGWWTFTGNNINAYKLRTASMEHISITDLTPMRHPASETIGIWVNSSPYSRMTLMFEPFGMIALDPMDFIRSNSLMIDITVDYVTGEGVLYIGNDPDKAAIDEPIKSVRAQIGVPILLSQTSRDYVGVASNLISSTVQGAIGNAVGFATGVVSAIGSLLPQIETTGAQGSCATYANVFPTLVQEFMPIKDIDVDHIGRPCCKNLSMATVGKGFFFQFEDGDVSIPCTNAELTKIKSYLESGVFYE